MNNVNADDLKSILENPAVSPEQRQAALGRIGEAAVEGDSLSGDAQAMLASLGLKPLALFAVSAEQFEKHCRARGVTGARYEALYDEWRDYHLPSDESLRLLYLADPATGIHWGWLAHWRNVLATAKKRLVRQFAEYSIGMLAKYGKLPKDVRAAASKFLPEFRKIEEGQPVPAIKIPGNERWPTMPHADLSGRMVRFRELQAAA